MMIGPRLRAIAVYPHNDIGISLHKVPRGIADLFQFRFTPAALVGFEKLLAVPRLGNHVARADQPLCGPLAGLSA
jgi:hypothetical protein